MANTRVQHKRSSVSGRQPNTTISSNTSYIAAGEFALNMADGILYTSDGTNLITIGGNTQNQTVSNNLVVGNVHVVNNYITVGNATVNSVINSTSIAYNGVLTLNSSSFTGTANNTLYVGTVTAANVVSNAQLTANLANYQTTAGLNANIAAYLPTYTGVVNGSSHTVGTSTIANSTGVYTTGTVNAASHSVGTSVVANTSGIYLLNNLNTYYQTINASAYVGFRQQNDDNFVFYTTNTAYGARAVWSIFANSITSNINFSVRSQHSGGLYIPTGATLLDSTGSQGTTGQYLTSNGTGNVYWSSPGAVSINTAAQYTWTNTQTFSANISYTGNGISFVTNTTAVYFNGITDNNWKMGRNTGGLTKTYYTGNTLDIVAYSAATGLEGLAIGQTGANVWLETGYNGTYTKNPIYVGNTTVNTSSIFIGNTTVNATLTTTGLNVNAATIANTTGVYTTGVVNAASYNTGAIGTGTGGFLANVTTILIGNNTINTAITSAGLTINGTAVVANSSGLFTTGTINAASHSAGPNVGFTSTSFLFTGNTTTSPTITLANTGSLTIGNSSTTQTGSIVVLANSSGNAQITPTSIVLSNATANVTVANLTGVYTNGVVNAAVLSTGTTFISNSTQLTITTVPLYANGQPGTNGQVLTANSAGSPYWSTVSGGGTVNVAAQYAWTNTQSFSNTITFTGAILANTVNATSYTIGTAVVANATGVYTTGVVNAASHTVGTSFVANTSQLVLSGIPLTANTSNGQPGQVLTSNGSTGAPYWASPTAASIRQQYTANGTANTFTVTGGYTANNLDVYVNGVKLYNGTEANVQNGSTFTILTGNPLNGSLIEVVGTLAGPTASYSYNRTAFTATAGQTSFTASYTVGYVQVYLNGVLLNGADYTATTGTTIVLASAAAAGDIVEVLSINVGTVVSGYARTSYIATGGQTSFTATYTPNYIQVYVNGVLLDAADYTATSGSAVVLSTAATAGDSVDIVALGGFNSSGVAIQGTPTTGQLATWNGSTSIQGFAPSAAGDVPFSTDGTTFASTQKIVRGTSVATTSGTAVTFSNIPSWVKRITIVLNGVKTGGSSAMLVQLGTAGGIVSTGYLSYYAYVSSQGTNTGGGNQTAGFGMHHGGSADILYNTMTLALQTGTTWVSSYSGGFYNGSYSFGTMGGGTITLGATATTVTLTSVSSDTFTAGSVNILYE